MACWFSFSLFLEISAVTYTTACARAYGFVLERHQRSDFFVEKLYGMRARALAVHALARSRAGSPATAALGVLGVLGGSAAKWTNVVWPIKRRQTNQQTNTHYSFIGIDTSVHIHHQSFAPSHQWFIFLNIHQFINNNTPLSAQYIPLSRKNGKPDGK